MPQGKKRAKSAVSPSEAKRQIESLRKEIHRHDYLYYVKDQPKISDEEYDRLFERLQSLEESFPQLVTPDSPTQRVGGEPRREFRSVRHHAPMLSLDATRDEAEVRRFDERVRKAVGKVDYLLEEKFDGASIEIVYEKGAFERAVTRGNGREGEDVSENVKTIRSVPLRLRMDALAAPSLLAIRGEVLMTISAFERLNRKLLERGNEPFANPRNAAAGSLRQLDPRITAERPLELIAYEVLATEEGRTFGTDTAVLDTLRKWGLRIPETVATVHKIDDAIEQRNRWNDKREQLDYEIDGLVIKVDRHDAREKLGATTHHPRWALAYKFEPRREQTRVMDIVVQVGRTGILTPVALMKPVEVGGVTVSRASLHNREEVRRKDVRVSDLVRIQRAGDVIPEVVERIPEHGRKRKSRFEMPSKCPACGTKVMERGPYTICPNRFRCPAQLKGRIEHFASKGALDIDRLGTETVAALVDRGLVKEMADLFRLKKNDLLQLEGFADKSTSQLLAAIEKSKQVDLDRFLYGLGIPEVGTAVARDIANHFGSLKDIREGSRSQLEQVPGIGPKMSEAICEFLEDERNQHAIDALLQAGVEVREREKPKEQPLHDQKFVFTGSLQRFSRSEAQKLVESYGARATSSVSAETDYVVAGEDPGQKLDAAKEKGVTVLDEKEFISLLKEKGIKL